MFILVTFWRGVPNFRFGFPNFNFYRPNFYNRFGNLNYGTNRFSQYGGAPQVYGPGHFAYSPFTRHPVGYWSNNTLNRNSPLFRIFGIPNTRALINNLNFRFNVQPPTNIGDMFFGLANNIERNLASSIAGFGSPVNISDVLNTDAFTNNLHAQVMSNYAPINVMDRINNSVDSSLSGQGLLSSASLPAATDYTTYMIIIKPLKGHNYREELLERGRFIYSV